MAVIALWVVCWMLATWQTATTKESDDAEVNEQDLEIEEVLKRQKEIQEENKKLDRNTPQRLRDDIELTKAQFERLEVMLKVIRAELKQLKEEHFADLENEVALLRRVLEEEDDGGTTGGKETMAQRLKRMELTRDVEEKLRAAERKLARKRSFVEHAVDEEMDIDLDELYQLGKESKRIAEAAKLLVGMDTNREYVDNTDEELELAEGRRYFQEDYPSASQ